MGSSTTSWPSSVTLCFRIVIRLELRFSFELANAIFEVVVSSASGSFFRLRVGDDSVKLDFEVGAKLFNREVTVKEAEEREADDDEEDYGKRVHTLVGGGGVGEGV